MDQTLNRHALDDDEHSSEPMMRPFELVAIGCGFATLIGTFAVSHTLLKGALIGGSLLVLIGSLLYFGFLATRSSKPGRHPTTAPRPRLRPRRPGPFVN